ncbi:MAG: hypothetical protein KIT31_29810 [Deltaproteobacteria bacterium]|nr:hypothetical protein [Deltaproteobacteria bacterium]
MAGRDGEGSGKARSWVGELAAGVASAARTFFDNGVYAGLRAATADGQGHYLGAMACFGLASLAFHYAILPQTSRENRLESTLSQRQEGLVGERYPVLAGLVTRPTEPLICGKAGGQLRKDLNAIADRFNELATERLVATDPITRAILGDLVTAPVDPTVLTPACEVQTPGVGPAWTDTSASTISTLFIPSTAAWRPGIHCRLCDAPLLEERSNCEGSARDDLLKDYRTAVLPASLAIDDLIQSSRHVSKELQLEGDLGKARHGIRSAYFISLGGMTRTLDLTEHHEVSRPESGTARVASYVPHYINSGTTYFTETVSRRKDDDGCRRHARDTADVPLKGFVTAPYLDTFGGGLVETFCRAVDYGTQLVGVLCIDVAHSEREVLEALGKIEAFDVTVLRIDKRLTKPTQETKTGDKPVIDADDIQLPDPVVSSRKEQSCAETTGLTSGELKTFGALYYRNRLLPRPGSLRVGGVFRDGCTEPTDCRFGVTVYSGDEHWAVAVIQLRRPRTRDFLALAACGLFGIGGIAALVLGYRRKMRQREAYIIRGLALGAMHVAANDQIVGGNDRAEAILGTHLPRLTLDGNEHLDQMNFSSFIDRSRCVQIDEDGDIGIDSVVSYDVVRWRCTDLLTTAFYAHVRRRGWVRVTARVIVQPEQRDDLLYVLDTHVCEHHRKLLAAILAKPVPSTKYQAVRRSLVGRKLRSEVVPDPDRCTLVYFCDQPEEWVRSLCASVDAELVVHNGVTTVDLFDDGGGKVDVTFLPMVAVADTDGLVCEVAILHEIEDFLVVRVREIVRRCNGVGVS